jgi:hypothetical protein
MGKKGNSDNETEAGHIFSWCLYNVFVTNMKPFKKMNAKQLKLFCQEMNAAENLRIKSKHGN